ncbi:hypothetical protein [Bacillus fonticola]|uniref:hypothetical protein n=1 Tax=Bacillus fonticola TaxID=2728853 RepID=UPI00147638F7|nr:hypothetical protein [Bacillus fonticola]
MFFIENIAHKFTQFWYIAAIVLYLVTQIVTVGMLPKVTAFGLGQLTGSQSDNVPSEYQATRQKTLKLLNVVHTFAFLLLVLMVWKPVF